MFKMVTNVMNFNLVLGVTVRDILGMRRNEINDEREGAYRSQLLSGIELH